MKRETTLLLAALGAIPICSVTHASIERTQKASSLNEGTRIAIKSLIACGALYASEDGTKLMIDSKALTEEQSDAIVASGRVQLDTRTSNLIVNDQFASAIAGARVLNESLAGSVKELLLLMNLEKNAKTVTHEEMLEFAGNPFMTHGA